MEHIVEDIIETIPDKNEDIESNFDTELFDFDENDDQFIHMDGGDVERVVDALENLFVSSDGQTIATILVKISETLDKHVETLDKQNKVLFRLAKVIEETKK